MRRWMLVAALVLAGCGSTRTADLTASATTSSTSAVTTTTVAAKQATQATTTTTVRPFSEYRDQVIKLIEGFGDRVDTIEMVPDGNRQVLRITYTSTYSTDQYLSPQGWQIATKLAGPLWDGDESNGSGLNLDLTVSDDKHKLVYHYVCKGEVMDRVKARKIVETDWVAACKA